MKTKNKKAISMRIAAIMTISVFTVLLMAIPGVLANGIPNPTFVTDDVDGDSTTAISIGWSTDRAQNGSHSVHVNTSGVSTCDYATVGVPTNFTLNVGTEISYWGYTMSGSGVTAPDEIFLFLNTTGSGTSVDEVVVNGAHPGVAGQWKQWNLSDTKGLYEWYTVNETLNTILVNISDYYGSKVLGIALGAGSPMSFPVGVKVDVYLDNLTVSGSTLTLLDDDTGTIEVLSGTIDSTPWTTSIQDGIDAALPGDTINVADGTYTITAAINVNKGVTITGNVANPENVVVQYSPASTSLNGFEIGAADITMQGFKIIDCFRGVHFGRSDVTSTGCTITNCVFDNNSENAIGEVAAENTTISNNAITNCNMGIEIRANEATNIAKRTEVTGNTISSCSQSCIQIYLGKYVYIYGNIISSTNDKGINIIRPTATGTLDRIQVIGNTISETKWPGIQVIGSPYTYVYSNTLTKCNYHGSDGTGDWDYASIHVQDDVGPTYSHHTVIDSNTVSDGINGIQTWSNDVSITNNEIYSMGLTYADTKGTAGVGDGVYYNSGIIIGSNWLTSNFKPTGTTVTCNNIHDNYWGLYVRDYATLSSPGDPSVLNVTAECNWWGDDSGPTHLSNPLGTGDNVSDNVDFDPWSFTPDPCETKTMGFWKNHEDSVEAILTEYEPIYLGDFMVDGSDNATAVFNNAKNKNANTMLAAQLLAAKLNVLHLAHLGIAYCPCVNDVISDADTFLSGRGYNGPDGPGIAPRGPDKQEANGYKDDLDEYNQGLCIC